MKQIDTKQDMQALRDCLERGFEMPEPTAAPVLIAVSGLPGSGKSSFCRQLSARLHLPIVESDVMRRTLFPEPTHSPIESQRLFRACHSLIKELIQRGISVIFDATNLVEHHREQLYRIADSTRAKLIFIRLQAPPELVRRRLQQRQSDIDPADSSNADWGVYQKMSKTVQPIRRHYFAVDTSQDIEPVIDKIVREVNR